MANGESVARDAIDLIFINFLRLLTKEEMKAEGCSNELKVR